MIACGAALHGRVLAFALAVSLFGCATPPPDPLVEIELWPPGASDQDRETDGGRSALYVRVPDLPPNGTALLVIPGGGYGFLAIESEGRQIADWLASIGVTSFVLRYRHAPAHHQPAPLQDARRAMQQIRAQAARFHVDPSRVGVIGFSAGGHLAAATGIYVEPGEPSDPDPVSRHRSRPDFQMLFYPVISFEGPYAHADSRSNFLGNEDTPELRRRFSLERHVTDETPPAFMVHTRGDTVVPVAHSIAFHDALARHRVPAALHVYAEGQHGLGLGPPRLAYSGWTKLAEEWLASRTSRRVSGD